MSKVLVAMSGGVDSSVCASLLRSQGHETLGVYMLLTEKADPGPAQRACESLDMEFMALDLREDFRCQVIDPFVSSYLSGQTPNPCILCNRSLKFGRLLELTAELGCDYLATGHYVRKTGEPGAWSLSMAKDEKKDQSYVLYNLTQPQLDRLLFPLGELSKDEVRSIALELCLESARAEESQDICFIPDGDYPGFISRYTGLRPRPGNFVSPEGEVIGRHRGVHAYTIGQRRGLGLPMGERVYVTAKDAAANTVTVGPESELMTTQVTVSQPVFTAGHAPGGPISVQARLRYSQRPQIATLSLDGGLARLDFQSPQRAPAPGQAAVFYQGQTLLGGGTIV